MYICLFLGFILTAMLIQLWGSGSLHFSIDFPTLFLLALLFLSVLAATKSLKKFFNSFIYALKNKPDIPLTSYQESGEIFSFAIRTLIIDGFVVTLLSFFHFMSDTKFTDIASLQASVCVSLYGIFYSIIGCFFLLPVKHLLHEKIINYVSEEIEPEEDREKLAERIYYQLRGMGLTAREAEVGRLIVCKNSTNKDIAEELYISEYTVKKHVSHIFEKLEISSRMQITELVNNSRKCDNNQ